MNNRYLVRKETINESHWPSSMAKDQPALITKKPSGWQAIEERMAKSTIQKTKIHKENIRPN